jgi:hypothetical protein
MVRHLASGIDGQGDGLKPVAHEATDGGAQMAQFRRAIEF